MDYHGINAKVRAMRNKPAPFEDTLKRLRLFVCDTQARRVLSLATEPDYLKAWAFIKSLPAGSQERKALELIKGTEIDLVNISRIYRMKRYFPSGEVYPQAVGVTDRLTVEQVKEMSESAGLAEFFVAVRGTAYAGLGFEDIEDEIFREMLGVYAKAARRYRESMAGVLGWLYEVRGGVF